MTVYDEYVKNKGGDGDGPSEGARKTEEPKKESEASDEKA